jgi:hypothetical protein
MADSSILDACPFSRSPSSFVFPSTSSTDSMSWMSLWPTSIRFVIEMSGDTMHLILPSPSPLTISVTVVIGLGSQEQVRQLSAESNIAVMTHRWRLAGDRSDEQHPCGPVGAMSNLVDHEHPIPLAIGLSCPQTAGTKFGTNNRPGLHFRQESLDNRCSAKSNSFHRRRSSGDHQRVSVHAPAHAVHRAKIMRRMSLLTTIHRTDSHKGV